MRKRSRREGGCAPECAMHRDDMVWNRQGDSAAAQATRRSVPVIGLWLVSASMVSGLLWQVIWIVDVNRLVQIEAITSEDIDDLPGRPRGTLHLVAVQRRRCRDCRQLYCDCAIWRAVCEGRHA
jgi:hypothetical protein